MKEGRKSGKKQTRTQRGKSQNRKTRAVCPVEREGKGVERKREKKTQYGEEEERGSGA